MWASKVRLAAASLSILAVACASARMSDHASDRLFRDGQYEEAAKKLEEGVKEEGENGRDLLLYLLDLGLALHAAGKYDESNQAFFRADKIADLKDYTSLATETATLLTSDNIKDYKGEDFEKVLINVYLGMNYALAGGLEDSLVECRVVNRKLHLMVTEGQRKYKQNAFARYLSAIIYEAEGEWNDAYIDYKKTRELMPSFPGLGRDLWRTARLMGMQDEMERWVGEYELTEIDHQEAMKLHPRSGGAEIVVIFENGISPIKKPHPNFYQVPKFYPRYNPVSHAKVEVDGVVRGETAVLHDIESTAIQNLDEKWGGILMKKIGGVVAKEIVADQIGEQTDPLVGFIAKMFFYASDQADVRSWNLLPKDLQIARIPVEPGIHTLKLHPVGAGGALPEKTVSVEKGKKVFVNFRYAPR